MRHNKKFNHLSRKKAHRDALLANMTIALIQRKRIFTTLAKAKALRVYAEPLINRSKEDSTANRRHVFSYLQDKKAVTELFREISQKVADRPGGYTRILKTGYRLGDNAQMCFIELVDYNEALLKAKEESKKPKTRRSRRSTKKADAAAPAAEEVKAEAPAEEVKADKPKRAPKAKAPKKEAAAEAPEAKAEEPKTEEPEASKE